MRQGTTKGERLGCGELVRCPAFCGRPCVAFVRVLGVAEVAASQDHRIKTTQHALPVRGVLVFLPGVCLVEIQYIP